MLIAVTAYLLHHGRFSILCRCLPFIFPQLPCQKIHAILWVILLLITKGGAQRHDFHHSNFSGSYGSFFSFWDWFCGTDVPYRANQLGKVTLAQLVYVPSFVAFSCCSMHLLMHLKQIAFGTGPAVGVRGGSIIFSGCSSEHVVAFQQLIPFLASSKTIRFSCKSCNSYVSEEVPIGTALQLLKCKGSVMLRWTRATSWRGGLRSVVNNFCIHNCSTDYVLFSEIDIYIYIYIYMPILLEEVSCRFMESDWC